MGWISGRWLGGAVLVAGGIGALFLANAADDTSPYIAGIALFILCVLGVFALISTAWGPSPLAMINPLPASGTVRWLVGGIAALLAIFGLFDARGATAGGLGYYQGLVLFAAAVGYAFLLLKDWFDRADAQRR